MRWFWCFGVLLVAACGQSPATGVSKSAITADGIATKPQPAMIFPVPSAVMPNRSNGQIAQDFLDLEFHMESGLVLPVLTRFDGPVTIGMAGNVPPTAPGDLALLMTRLRNEAGLDVVPASPGSAALITIDFEPQAVLKQLEPTAACFVVPNVSSLAEYRSLRGSEALNWPSLTTRRKAAIFVPSDTSAQEVRDCLHEETAQALGPLNDLYRLPDSVFNDDNFQSVLTGFDMLMLRLHYAPELQSNMPEAEVRARLPALLARLNPAGDYAGNWSQPDTPREWIDAVARALGPNTPASARLPAARTMLDIAKSRGWQDNRLGFAWYAYGRMQAPHDPLAAEADYTNAAHIYAGLPDGGIHLSHALMQLSAIALATGRPELAISLADQALPLAKVGQNAALEATLLLIKSQSLGRLGRTGDAAKLRLDSLAAARYGFGSDPEVRAREDDIAALAQHPAGG